MQIVIEQVGLDVSSGLKSYIEERGNKFFGKHHYITSIDVYVKEATEKKEEPCIIEAKVFLPGPELYAEAAADSHHVALNQTIDKLRRQLEKYKEKYMSHRA